MKISIGSDHAGFKMKEHIIKFLKSKQIEVIDKGTYSEERADYPDYGHAVANAIENNETPVGIVICGSGNGINMAANKHKGIRSALCWNSEIAALAKQHNNANILALPGRYISEAEGESIVEAFLSAEFEGGRHADRINKIPF